jgi:purine-nucleoside phosphorylase
MNFTDIFGKKIDLGTDSSVYVEQVVGAAKKLDHFFAADFKKFGIPEFCIILGTSGPKGLINLLDSKKVVSYSQLGFPISKVAGHSPNENGGPESRLHYGILGGVPVIICVGRIHYYECRDMDKVTLMVRSICLLGIKDFIITNASGSLFKKTNNSNIGSRVGEYSASVAKIVVVSDFINYMNDNPLIGDSDYFHSFADPNKVLDKSFMNFFPSYNYPRRTYIAVTGRSFETKSEAVMYSQFGDLMGMSSVPELLAIAQQGGKALVLSLVTNFVASDYSSEEEVKHEDNLKVVADKDEEFSQLIFEFVLSFKL